MLKRSLLLVRALWTIAGLLVISPLTWALEVNLAEHLPYIDCEYEGKLVRIQRIQDTSKTNKYEANLLQLQSLSLNSSTFDLKSKESKCSYPPQDCF